MLHLILFIHVAFLYIPLSISPPSLSRLFILCRSWKPSGFAVCLDIFRRGCCCCSCCCCRRGKYASISFTPCNVVGLTATPDCAPGLLFNYFVNVFLLSFLPLHSSLFFCCCCLLCATSKSQSHWPSARPVLSEISHPSGSCLALPLICDSMCSAPDQLMSRCHWLRLKFGINRQLANLSVSLSPLLSPSRAILFSRTMNAPHKVNYCKSLSLGWECFQLFYA